MKVPALPRTASVAAGTLPDPLIESIVRATVARNERLITGRELEIADPVYRLLERTTPAPWGPQLPPEPGLELDQARLPALAGVVLRNRENPSIELTAALFAAFDRCAVDDVEVPDVIDGVARPSA